MLTAPSIIDELESTMRAGSAAQRADVLRRITDLFLQYAPACNDEQIALFDDVMLRLVDRIEHHALVRLSAQLAPLGNAPAGVIHALAADDDADVATPVIRQSPVLTDDALVEIARSKGEDHLTAIADRAVVTEKVTDALVERDNPAVTLRVTRNTGARFSRHALMTVAHRASDDAELAETMVRRDDVPPDIFQNLLIKATELVRERLLKNAEPEARARVNDVLADVANHVATSEGGAQAFVLTSKDPIRLKLQIGTCARAGKRSETVASLAALSKLPIQAVQSLLNAEAEDAVLILCKTIALDWNDVRDVLGVMTSTRYEDSPKTKAAFRKYYSLTEETAHRVINFVKACKGVSKADLHRML
jgi:uncharacterized protein (DUF2336 family)